MEHMTGFFGVEFASADSAKAALAAAQQKFCKGANHATDISFVDSKTSKLWFKRGIANVPEEVVHAFLKEQPGCINVD